MKTSVNSARGGFTILEILIAMTIFAVVLASIYTTWTAVLKGAQAGNAAADEAQRSRMSFRSLQQSLDSAMMFEANGPLYGFQSETSSKFASLSFVSRLPGDFPGTALYPGQPVRRVSFDVEAVNGANSLVMRQQSIMAVEDTLGAKPYPIVLARNVSTFTVEFWDSRAKDWAVDWVSTNQLPQLVRVSIGTTGAKSRSNARQAPDRVESHVMPISGTAVALQDQVTPVQAVAPGGAVIRRGPNGELLRIDPRSAPNPPAVK